MTAEEDLIFQAGRVAERDEITSLLKRAAGIAMINGSKDSMHFANIFLQVVKAIEDNAVSPLNPLNNPPPVKPSPNAN